jgi:hypothetical protein
MGVASRKSFSPSFDTSIGASLLSAKLSSKSSIGSPKYTAASSEIDFPWPSHGSSCSSSLGLSWNLEK